MIYNEEHSITFIREGIEKNTWKDWRLVPTSKPYFSPPSVKTHYVDVPGSNGIIDLTEVVSGSPNYSNREGSFEFLIDSEPGPNFSQQMYHDIMNYLHGREADVIILDDPEYKYHGRFSVNGISSSEQQTNSNITIDYSVDPFRTELTDSITPWKWDPFNFYDGVITYNQTYIFETEEDHTTPAIPYRGFKVNPIFRVEESSNLKLKYEEQEYELQDGDNSFPEVFIFEGNSGLTFSGIGTVQIIYNIRRL